MSISPIARRVNGSILISVQPPRTFIAQQGGGLLLHTATEGTRHPCPQQWRRPSSSRPGQPKRPLVRPAKHTLCVGYKECVVAAERIGSWQSPLRAASTCSTTPLLVPAKATSQEIGIGADEKDSPPELDMGTDFSAKHDAAAEGPGEFAPTEDAWDVAPRAEALPSNVFDDLRRDLNIYVKLLHGDQKKSAELRQSVMSTYRRVKAAGKTLYPCHLYSHVLNVCIRATDGVEQVADVEEIFQDMVELGVEMPESIYSGIVKMHVRMGKLSKAVEVLSDMLESGASPRFRTYEPVLRAMVRQGDKEGTLRLWRNMKWHSVTIKESFLVDLMEDLGIQPDDPSQQSLEERDCDMIADKVMSDMSQVFIYPSEQTVKGLVNGKQGMWARVTEQGRCSACGGKLQELGMSHAERQDMRSALMHVAALNGASQVQELCKFVEWFTSLEEPPTAVIDGPNIGYSNQNCSGGKFSYSQVDEMVMHLQSLGERVMIIMPQIYTLPKYLFRSRASRPVRDPILAQHEVGLLKKWSEEGMLYPVYEGRDDWYWMYSTVARDDVDTVAVTNDLARDHSRSIL
ncbi:unnamed protein product, partial [Discosporangium mesarthrocarpum]